MDIRTWNLAADGQGAELVCNKSPFQQGRKALLIIQVSSTFNGTINFQKADDAAGTAWTNMLTSTQLGYLNTAGAGAGSCSFGIVLGEKVRPTLSGRGAGEVNFILVGAT